MYGGWVGMLIGGLEGLPHEFKYKEHPRPELPELTFLPNGARSDDDNDFEWTHLWFMEKKASLKIPYAEIVEIWKANMNQGIWVANKRARELMDKGLLPPQTSQVNHNPYAWYNLAGQFCVESYGMLAPGMPQTAADLGLHYARISVSQEPLQATQFWTSLISLSFVYPEESIETSLRRALPAVDPRSAMHQVVEEAIAAWKESAADWKAARQRFQQKWHNQLGWNYNSTPLNGAAVCLALLYGQGDFYRTLQYAMALGWDADCNAATAGAVMGVRWGFRRISQLPQFKMPDRYVNKTRPQLPPEIPVSQQVQTILRLAERVILANGGQRLQEDGQIFYRIRLQEPKLLEPLPENPVRPTLPKPVNQNN